MIEGVHSGGGTRVGGMQVGGHALLGALAGDGHRWSRVCTQLAQGEGHEWEGCGWEGLGWGGRNISCRLSVPCMCRQEFEQPDVSLKPSIQTNKPASTNLYPALRSC